MEPLNAGPQCYLDRLPEHILAKVFSMGNWDDRRDTPNFARYCELRTVCKLFHRAINQVEDLGCHIDGGRIQEMHLVRFLEDSDKVKFLCLVGAADFVFSNTFLALVLRVAKSLTSLRVDYASLGPAGDAAEQFLRILSSSSVLESLMLNYFIDLSFKGQLHSKYQLRHLKILDIAGAAFSQEGLTSLLKLCPSLTTLMLAQTSGLERACIQSSSLLSFVWNEDESRSVERFEVDAALLTSLVMPPVVEAVIHASALEELEVSFLGRLTGMQFPNLRELRVTDSYRWTGDQLLRLLRQCARATTVQLDAEQEGEDPAERVALAKLLTTIKNVRKLVLKEGGSFSITSQSLPLLQNLDELELAFYPRLKRKSFQSAHFLPKAVRILGD